jgi:hypothetical protein
MSDDDGMALLRLSANGTDGEWYAETGACGGCGDERCHDGPCVEDAWGLCQKCPDRKAQGLA